MLGSSLVGSSSSSPSKNRVFVYEVTGLRQNETNDNNQYQIRSSSSIFVRVPYSRMNEEMQRISKMGGTIVNIQSIDNWQKSTDVSEEKNHKSEE